LIAALVVFQQLLERRPHATNDLRGRDLLAGLGKCRFGVPSPAGVRAHLLDAKELEVLGRFYTGHRGEPALVCGLLPSRLIQQLDERPGQLQFIHDHLA
jgi:hypothetical protein